MPMCIKFVFALLRVIADSRCYSQFKSVVAFNLFEWIFETALFYEWASALCLTRRQIRLTECESFRRVCIFREENSRARLLRLSEASFVRHSEPCNTVTSRREYNDYIRVKEKTSFLLWISFALSPLDWKSRASHVLIFQIQKFIIFRSTFVSKHIT